ncbi:DUF5686 family protein [Sphingobacterium spiritivorum]|uniref:DUF5686 family protein n=1 Tax=Sphingobacterium spiritivorum TaxID=258 RepID=UPI003DA3DDB7
MIYNKKLDYILLVGFLLLMTCPALGQLTIKGRVVDRNTGHGIPRATIVLAPGNLGTSTDTSGNFAILANKNQTSIQFRAMGYTAVNLPLTQDSLQQLSVELDYADNMLEMVTISKRSKSKKDDPALELIDLVIKHKKDNRLRSLNQVQFEEYEKVQFGLVDPRKAMEKRMGKLKFIFKNLDTASIKGKALLPMYMEENLSDVYSQTDPSKYKKLIKSHKKTEFDPRYINNANIQQYLNYQFRPVDIYDPSIFIINKLFLSPIADEAKLFYRFYIQDTIQTVDGTFVELAFEPKNKQDLLFSGTLQVTTDGRYAVRQAELTVGKEANLNWINDILISLHYDPNADGFMFLRKSDLLILFGGRKDDALFGRRVAFNSKWDFKSQIPAKVFEGAPTEMLASASQDTAILERQRPIPLNKIEQTVYSNTDSLNNMKSFKRLMAIGYLLAQGFHNAGPVEFGPLEYTYSFNEVEGNRIRFGGRTTGQLSEKVYMEGYLAYGVKDQQMKYYLRSAFSLNNKSVTTFPAHYLEGTVQHDVMEPGRGIGFKKGDSFFASFSGTKPEKFLFNDAYKLNHVWEFGNHISISTGFTYFKRETAGTLVFNKTGIHAGETLPRIVTNDVDLQLRWAPNENFYYRNLTRTPIIDKYPVFTLQYNQGIKGFLGGEYNYSALRLAASKRLFLNQLGTADLTLGVGKIWGALPYPLLEIPNVQIEQDRHTVDYFMMNSMEFAADRYVKFAIDHRLQGFLLNKIPLIKKLKWRELWRLRMFYGDLSPHNNPYISNEVVYFDKDDDGRIVTRTIDQTPYMEATVGVENVLRFFTVEYVKRLSYREYDNVRREKVRLTVHFNF